MKIQIPQESLAKALSITSRFANSKAQLPVLGNVLFSANKQKLYLASTNLEVSVLIKLAAKVEKEGEITIPSKVVTELMGNLGPGIINLEAIKEQLEIKKDGFESKLLGMNSNDFPKIPQEVNLKNSVKINTNKFSKAASQVLFSASSDETRPILTGILVIIEKGSITLVSTDGFRLSQKKLNYEGIDEARVVIPRNSVLEIVKLFQEEEELSVDFKSGDNQIVCGGGDIVLSSRLIGGDYPNFQKIIPTSSLYKISVNREDLLRAVKLSSVLARDSANILKIKLTSKSLNLFTESTNSGKEESLIEAKVEGIGEKDDFEIAFNYKFIEDFLNSTSSQDIEIKMSDVSSASIFLDPKDPEYLHLIMPVRIQG